MCVRGYRVRGAHEVEAGLLGMWTLKGQQESGHQRRLAWGGRREAGRMPVGGSLKKRNQRGLTEEGAERRFCN